MPEEEPEPREARLLIVPQLSSEALGRLHWRNAVDLLELGDRAARLGLDLDVSDGGEQIDGGGVKERQLGDGLSGERASFFEQRGRRLELRQIDLGE